MGENAVKIYAGTSRRLRVSVQDRTNPDNLVNIPVSDSDRVRLTIRPNTNPNSAAVIEKDSNNVGEVEFDVGNQPHVLDIILLPSDTLELEEGTYVYDVKINFAATQQEVIVVFDQITLVRVATQS